MSGGSNEIIFYSIGILSVGLSIIVFGLDMIVMIQTTDNASIAMPFFDADISFSDIYIATFFLGLFFMFGLGFSIALGWIDKRNTLIVSTGTIIFLNIPREGIAYKFFICFNQIDYRMVQARAILTFISIIVLSVVHILSVIDEKNQSGNKIEKRIFLFILVTSFLVLIGIGVLNIFTLINLNTDFKKNINPKTIKIGYFTENEIAQIEQNNFIKDSNYTSRIINNLNNIVNSDYKKIADRTCRKSGCYITYIRTLNAQIYCNSKSKNFYSDCSSAEKLVILMKYQKGRGYPIYNCAVVEKNSTCRQGCPGLANHQLYLVQEFNNKVELGWNGFCNCKVKSPRIKLTEDIGLNICDNL
ncbi:unnamed protein product [Brachionus calyciflorus]|uniref:Uncharacterized protein n=1 Tax=Brachionus calyciflorus TaxID=104777 RepID=A0A814Q4G8_9BILA|nr:unnamed protein product [Brachionus calyciflorus]